MNIGRNLKQLFAFLVPLLGSKTLSWVSVVLFAIKSLRTYPEFAQLPLDKQTEEAFNALWQKDPDFVTKVGPEKLKRKLPALLSAFIDDDAPATEAPPKARRGA